MLRWLKRIATALFILIVCLLLLIGIIRLQAIQYFAANTGSGYAKELPTSNAYPVGSHACSSQPMRVLTYNVRYGSDFLEALMQRSRGGDPAGFLPWSVRYPEIRKRIASYAPDLIGLQEMGNDKDIENIVSFDQYTLLNYHLGDFQYGDSALLFKTSRFDMQASGQLWLGPNPKLPLSLGFKPLAMIRYVNWAVLKDKTNGFTFLFVNTHFDNNALNKELSSNLFYERISKLTTGLPMIVVGDFNSKGLTERYRRLIGADDVPPRLINAYDLAHAPTVDAALHPNQRIDHILAGGPCQVTATQWQVDTKPLSNGQAMSDHDPIFAVLQFAGAKD